MKNLYWGIMTTPLVVGFIMLFVKKCKHEWTEWFTIKDSLVATKLRICDKCEKVEKEIICPDKIDINEFC